MFCLAFSSGSRVFFFSFSLGSGSIVKMGGLTYLDSYDRFVVGFSSFLSYFLRLRLVTL